MDHFPDYSIVLEFADKVYEATGEGRGTTLNMIEMQCKIDYEKETKGKRGRPSCLAIAERVVGMCEGWWNQEPFEELTSHDIAIHTQPYLFFKQLPPPR